MSLNAENSKEYYEAQYRGDRYASYASPEAHPFHRELKNLLSRHGCIGGKWLEVGCGRGLLQDMVEDYTGVDVSETVSMFLRKPFHCAPAESLPFEDARFDGAWSYAVLEHVENPGRALAEMRRVLKAGGILFLSPAWQCRPWASRDYGWKSFRELSLPDRIRKGAMPLRDSVVFRALAVLPRRLLRLAGYLLSRTPTPFRSRRLEPNYADYRVVDADARHHMDPFDAILWFRSRGDRVRSHAGWRRALFVRTGTLVVEVGKP
jgi:SAM-dependent methyltransferase